MPGAQLVCVKAPRKRGLGASLLPSGALCPAPLSSSPRVPLSFSWGVWNIPAVARWVTPFGVSPGCRRRPLRGKRKLRTPTQRPNHAGSRTPASETLPLVHLFSKWLSTALPYVLYWKAKVGARNLVSSGKGGWERGQILYSSSLFKQCLNGRL